MSRWQVIAVVLLSAALAGTAVWYIQHKYDGQKEQIGKSHRQLIYQSILQSYTASLNNGMTRAQMEDHLRIRGAQFSKICCLEQGASSAEITRIGFEVGPWYCTGYDVYVAFHFTGSLASEDPTDTLKKISIESLPVDCL